MAEGEPDVEPAGEGQTEGALAQWSPNPDKFSVGSAKVSGR
jgi:hypothetical protein